MDIVESLIARLGQSQEQRLPAELGPHFADVEERRTKQLYKFVAEKLATKVHFYGVNPAGNLAEDGDWKPFFPDALPGARDGTTAPHLALFAAFLKLYRVARCAMNGITARHMDFLYRRMLGFAPRPAQPDRAHVLVELKKGAQGTKIGPEHLFSGGKDKAGNELVYAPAEPTIVNAGKVEQLCSVFVDRGARDRPHFAPIAASADGLGAKLQDPDHKWLPFGDAQRPLAQVGFALASPVLRMKEGTRCITLTLGLEDVGSALQGFGDFTHLLACYVTGETRWLGPYVPEGSFSLDGLKLSFTVEETDEAVVDYDRDVHGHAFASAAPVVKVLLSSEQSGAIGYADLASIAVKTAEIAVEVEGVKSSLQLENDFGPLDARRAFELFGPQPVVGSRLLIGCPEALGKKLDELRLELNWLDLPSESEWNTRYNLYTDAPDQSQIKAQVLFEDAAGWRLDTTVQLFDTPDWTFTAASSERPWQWAGRGDLGLALAYVGNTWAAEYAVAEGRRYRRTTSSPPPKPRPGAILVRLKSHDFMHAQYRNSLVKRAPVLSEPYTPVLSEFALHYRASTGQAALDSTQADSFAADDVQFFHVDCFGERREHAFLRHALEHAGGERVPLVAPHDDEGELLVGLSGLKPEDGESVSLLVQVAEGSADPDAERQPVAWAVLADNYWKLLADADAVRDGSNGLLKSGLVVVQVPKEASVKNTLLAPGLLWLKASMREKTRAACSLVRIEANGVEVVRRAGEADTDRAWMPLPQGRIARLRTPVREVKAVSQPFASFGGRAPEGAVPLRRRAAERLRHRQRCITAWDYERAVLEAFPQVRKAKCIAHSLPGGPWLAPGNVLMIVVPDLRQRNAVDPLRPRVDSAALRDIEACLRAHAGKAVVIAARNARYQRVRLDFKVRFRNQLEFNYHSRLLRRALIDYLSPWTLDPGRAIEFGGAIHKSVLLDFVEDLPYVDFVTDFRMQDRRGGPDDLADVDEARAATPDAIIVSDDSHDIAEAPA